MITIHHVKDYTELSKTVASLVAIPISSGRLCNLGTPTGGTPVGMYKELVGKNLNWAAVHTFNLDEYVGISHDHPQSYHYFMRENLHSHIRFNDDHIHFPHEKYDEEINVHGALDITILGIGTNGHIAFNEPHSSFDSVTRIVNLTEQTIKDNSRFFDTVQEVPTQAITMGLATIMNSRQIILMASGKSKWDILCEAMWGEVTERVPASILQRHTNLKVFYCD